MFSVLITLLTAVTVKAVIKDIPDSHPPQNVYKVAYWDDFSCGSRGDDHNAGDCGGYIGGLNRYTMGCPDEIESDNTCSSGTAILSFACGNSLLAGKCESCYFWYAEYQCLEDYEGCRWQKVPEPGYYKWTSDDWWAYQTRNLNREEAIMKCKADPTCNTVTCGGDGQWCSIRKGTDLFPSSSGEVSYKCVPQNFGEPTQAPTTRQVADRAYWDAGSCGPDGDDHNFGLCLENGDFIGCPYRLENDNCPHNGKMVMDLVRGYGSTAPGRQYEDANKCSYYWYSEYVCETEDTWVWTQHLDKTLGAIADSMQLAWDSTVPEAYAKMLCLRDDSCVGITEELPGQWTTRKGNLVPYPYGDNPDNESFHVTSYVFEKPKGNQQKPTFAPTLGPIEGDDDDSSATIQDLKVVAWVLDNLQYVIGAGCLLICICCTACYQFCCRRDASRQKRRRKREKRGRAQRVDRARRVIRKADRVKYVEDESEDEYYLEAGKQAKRAQLMFDESSFVKANKMRHLKTETDEVWPSSYGDKARKMEALTTDTDHLYLDFTPLERPSVSYHASLKA